MGGAVDEGLIAGVRKIAVLRAGGLGDGVFALPALEALRAAYPQAEVVLLGGPRQVPLFASRPGPVDRVVPLPPIPVINERAGEGAEPGALDAFIESMRAERFDLALQLHGGGRQSNALVRAFGARVTAGCATADAPRLDRSLPHLYYQSEVERWLEVVALVGAPPVTHEPRLAVTDDERAEAARAVPGLDGARPLATLHPGAGDVRRHWPPDRFAAVGDALHEAGAEVVLVGGAEDRRAVDATLAAMRAPAVDVAEQLGLGALAGLFASTAVHVGNDSGPLHLARAAGARTVGIFWLPNLINAGPPGRRRHRPVVSYDLHCPACGLLSIHERCAHDVSFVASVAMEEVRDAALALLADATQERRDSS